MSNSSVWPWDTTPTGTTSLGQNGLGRNGNKGVLHISQSSSITGAFESYCLMSYSGHSLQWGRQIPLQRCSQCILLPQLNGLVNSMIFQPFESVSNRIRREIIFSEMTYFSPKSNTHQWKRNAHKWLPND